MSKARFTSAVLCLAGAMAGCYPVTVSVPQPTEVDPPECPDLNADGTRRPLTPPGSASGVALPPRVAVPADLIGPAFEVVRLFEAGGGDPHTNISSLDGISLGYLQWNHGTGSLYSTFLRNIPDVEIGLAPQSVREDLLTLKSEPAARTAIIASWLFSSGGLVDPAIREGLVEWLGLPEIRARQDALVLSVLERGYSAARAWRRDSDSTAPVTAQLVTYFFDLYTLNDGPQGVWVPQVRAFREEHATPDELLAEIEAWLAVCVETAVPGHSHTKLYNRDDALRNARYWRELLQRNPALFTDDTIDLLVFGYLRARRSTGDNDPNGFPGIFQADVMLRRGIIAVGTGYPPGAPSPVTIFTPQH